MILVASGVLQRVFTSRRLWSVWLPWYKHLRVNTYLTGPHLLTSLWCEVYQTLPLLWRGWHPDYTYSVWVWVLGLGLCAIKFCVAQWCDVCTHYLIIYLGTCVCVHTLSDYVFRYSNQFWPIPSIISSCGLLSAHLCSESHIPLGYNIMTIPSLS